MKHLLTLMICFTAFNLFASNTPIEGIVLDSETKEPLPFANIAIESKNTGTISNIEGRFVLNMNGIEPDNLVAFSYIGYKTLKISISELQNKSKIYLHPVTVNLQSVQVLSKSPTAEEIIHSVIKNYRKNYPDLSSKQRIFYHNYEKLNPCKDSKIIMKKSNFVGMDTGTFNKLFKMSQKEMIEYQDAIIELYKKDNSSRLVPIEGISLEENSQQALTEELTNKVNTIVADVEKNMNDKKTYYKFRTGIFSKKIGQNGEIDSSNTIDNSDDKNYYIKTEKLKADIKKLFKDYANIKSYNWEFINEPKKYSYSLKEVTIFNDELVYEITFTPKSRGLFKGRMFVSTSTYAVLRLDFAFEEGKQSDKFQFLGFGYSTNFKKGSVIFEKADSGYFVKYIYAQQKEWISIERNISIMKKKKRLLFDKNLNKTKLKTDLSFDMNSFWEILVLDREEIDPQEFEKAKQPEKMKFKKEYAYTPEMWSNRTIIAPTSELKKYKRK